MDVRRRARAPRPPRPDATNGRTDFPLALARRGCANYEGPRGRRGGRGARVGGALCAVVERQDLRVLRISLQNFLNFFSLTLEDYFCNFFDVLFYKNNIKNIKKKRDYQDVKQRRKDPVRTVDDGGGGRRQVESCVQIRVGRLFV